MRAVVVHGADDLRIDERPDPVPGPGEVLVAMEWGGICGSDLAYWRHAASGTAVLTQPLVLGHEVAGRIAAVGAGRHRPRSGSRSRSTRPSWSATACLPERIAGRTNLYPRIRYFGSAAFDPHTDGGFSELRVVRADQIRPLPEGVSTEHGALAEPLAVALHAVHRAGDLRGRDVVVNGAGPIGSLVVAAAKYRGAATRRRRGPLRRVARRRQGHGRGRGPQPRRRRHPARGRRAGVRGVGRPGGVGERAARDRPRRHPRPGGQPARRPGLGGPRRPGDPGDHLGGRVPVRRGDQRRAAWRCATASTWRR